MSRNMTLLSVAGICLLSVALAIAGCSSGDNSGPTAPPDPIMTTGADSSSGSSGSSGAPDQVAFASIDIEKRTNDIDADFPPGIIVPAESVVTWTYTITNNGDEELTITSVVDDIEGDVPGCPAVLGPGASDDCDSITGNAGTDPTVTYTNVATVTAETASGEVVTDSDASNHTPGESSIVLEVRKSTNGEDADSRTGPIVLAEDIPGGLRENVIWTYSVTNLSAVPVDITAEDTLDGGPPTAIACLGGTLAAGGTVDCSSDPVPADPEQHANVLTVEATANGDSTTASDQSHYFGAVPGISLVKKTDDQEMPIGRIPGCPVTWTYEITNTGNTELESIELVDDPEGAISCPSTSLASLDSMTCTQIGTVQDTDYVNEATVTGSFRIAQPGLVNLVEAFDDDGYTVDFSPICGQIVPSTDELWPPNHRLEEVELLDGDCNAARDIEITRVFQDEPVNGLGDGDTGPPDAVIHADGSVELRRERAGGGDGRVYKVFFDVLDVAGDVACSGSVIVGVPHDQGGGGAVDSGEYWDSETGDPI